ncbi:tubulin nucleotide-binding domain-like protein [Daedalea quercina L-15889]|uniref:Tubulin nucleotide-binding domain-like protein n=1 Tax=Daedalea quercina L-15889 TaxID=1314783 RepID=A0A165QG03_9APHY|nr:tubulin nucleotide-binding domain-like protein [Daedalea quercina L-15889]
MKEIVYVQAGQFANYIGTHFWNTQDAYFTYGEDEQSEIDHDVSFREGSTLKGESTYSPRLLLFDRRSNFGTIASTSGLYNSEDDNPQEQSLWHLERAIFCRSGGVVEYRQEPIPPSDYHTLLEHEAADDRHTANNDDKLKVGPQAADPDVRFWSDYSRVFLHPRSSQRLPDTPDWESTEGNWLWSKETFERHNAGIQVMNDTSTFGGFTSSFLTAYRDEFPKLSCLVFPILSHSLPFSVGADDDAGLRVVVNDALYLHALASLATLTVPVQAPETWVAGAWLDGIELNFRSPFQTSAVLSTHVESATLPLRLKGTMQDLEGLCGVLNWGGSNRFAHLSGAFPLPSPPQADRDLVRRYHDFSLTSGNGKKAVEDPTSRLEFARIYVARGFSSSDRRTLDAWTETRRPTPYTVFAPGYPIPSSFPRFLDSPSLPTGDKLRSPTSRVLSSLHTTSHTSELFKAYFAVIDDCVRRGAEVLGGMGLEKDDALELRDGLSALRDTYVGLEEGDAVTEDLELDDDEE